ncbi:hypothetical protein ONS95_012682 [Cadophora gregata]|uniref:uncharacterized protein n=1 Tax=Cadophora gregata TaxID=51156 RepID=UPI0026DAE03C|nr:uncharacterized protein ONS95_012682 [Cadophora gregata]KAK0118393.1 hypothetical protein ONS95_012682 [Cadophora gregata]KAK0123461.1 hypothetical protein ONS96_010445 [Cadophora gregata f. sp. sojae]
MDLNHAYTVAALQGIANQAPGSIGNANRVLQPQAHHALNAGGDTLTITLDFASDNNLLLPTSWDTVNGAAFRAGLCAAISCYKSTARKISIEILQPAHIVAINTGLVYNRQQALIHRIVRILNQFRNIEKLEMYYRSPETDWEQIRCLAPLYALTFKRWNLRIFQARLLEPEMSRNGEWRRRVRGLWDVLQRRYNPQKRQTPQKPQNHRSPQNCQILQNRQHRRIFQIPQNPQNPQRCQNLPNCQHQQIVSLPPEPSNTTK